MHLPTNRAFLLTELALFMFGVPLLLWLVLPPKAILPVVWCMAVICYLIAQSISRPSRRDFWKMYAVNWANLRPLLVRFAICGSLMVAATALFKPQYLFAFIRERPGWWALVMLFYPLVSVVPQEIIFRTYVFKRYATLLHPPIVMLVVSAIGFGFAHIAFNNWVAPAMCAVGGLIFAHTYQKTGSLALVSLEHALYGDFLFTVGLGRYFFHGAVGHPVS